MLTPEGQLIVRLAEGVFGELLKTGIKRLTGMYSRLTDLRRAFESGDQVPKPLERALDDIRRVTGSQIGIYTEGFEAFLTDLKDTGIITHMAEAALAGFTPIGAKFAFLDMFRDRFGKDTFEFNTRTFSSSELFDRISSMLRESIWSQSAVDANTFATRGALRTIREEIEERDRVVRDQFGSSEVSTVRAAVREALARSVARDLASKSIATFSEIWIPGPHRRQRRFALDAVFTPMPICLANTRDGSGAAILSYAELIDCVPRCILLGDPGGGKSTICQAVCLELNRRTSVGASYLAVRVTIREFESASLKIPQLSIFEYVVRELSKISESYTAEELREPIRWLLIHGCVFIAFDGLDEILATARRKDFVDAVSRFGDTYPLCPTLVTSRVVGYSQLPMPQAFSELRLLGLDHAGRVHYAQRALEAVFDVDRANAASGAEEIAARSEREAPDITTNPLMFALIVWLHQERGGEMPNDRASLFKECTELLFRRWDPGRDIYPDIPTDFDIQHLLVYLAPKFYLDPVLAAGVSRNWLSKTIEQFFLEQFGPTSLMRARAASEKVVDFVTGRAWVLTDHGPDQYQFAHRTFLEFYFAMSLCDRLETTSALFAKIAPYIQKGEWNVASHLALQARVGNSQTRAQEATLLLFELCEKSVEAHWAEVSYFAAQALEYLMAAEPDIERLAALITKMALRIPDGRKQLDLLLRSSTPRCQAIYRGVAREIGKELEQWGNPLAFGQLVDMLYARKLCSRRGALWLARHQLTTFPAFVTELTIGFDKFLSKRAYHYPSSAKAAFDLFDQMPAGSAGQHGLRLWEEAVASHGRANWLLLDITLALQDALTNISNELPPSGACLTLLRELAQCGGGTYVFNPASATMIHPDWETVSFPILKAGDDLDTDVVLGLMAAIAIYLDIAACRFNPQVTIRGSVELTDVKMYLVQVIDARIGQLDNRQIRMTMAVNRGQSSWFRPTSSSPINAITLDSLL